MMSHAQASFTVRKSKVFIVDDHPIVRHGLALLINAEPDLAVCGDAAEAHTALQAISAAKPDLIILDLSLAGPDGIELLKNVRLRNTELPVLVLSVHDESTYAERALRAGANGYIMKQEETGKLLFAIRRVLNHQIYVSDHVASRVLEQHIGRSASRARSPIEGLSDRELEVFRLIGQGNGTRRIAEELRLSIKTVESYQAHIKEKLAFHNAREMVQHAVQWVISEGQ